MLITYLILFIAFLVLLWFACGFIAMGYTFAYFQRKYPITRKEQFNDDVKVSANDLLFGPISFFGFFKIKHYGYGWLNPFSKKARKEAGLL